AQQERNDPQQPGVMAKLPIVRSAWSRLSHVYTDTKSSHPNFKVICDALEDRAVIWRTMASNTVSPVMMKLEPQISIANYIACKSLDWLESTFSLHLMQSHWCYENIELH
uniref:Uncharacterized protein n=1 Tax=Neogobius melanostomus TaxID=47308 RepID=A0A8C6T2F7_9GOBI